MCFWPNLLVCALGVGAGAGLSFYLHFEEATRSNDGIKIPARTTTKLDDQKLESLLLIHRAVTSRIEDLIQERERRANETTIEHSYARDQYNNEDNYDGSDDEDAQTVGSTSTRSSKVIEWLESDCGASKPSSEAGDVYEQEPSGEATSFSAGSETLPDENAIDANGLNDGKKDSGLDPADLERFEELLSGSSGKSDDASSETSSPANPFLNSSSTGNEDGWVTAQTRDRSDCSTDTSTPKGGRSQSPAPSDTDAPTAEEIQRSLDSKGWEFAEGSVSNFSVASLQSSIPDFSAITIADGSRVKGRYAVCMIMLNEVSFLPCYIKDRHKGPRHALHAIQKRTEEFFKYWRRAMPKNFHVVFYLDRNGPLLSRPEGVTMIQISNFLSAMQMLNSTMGPKVSVVTKCLYPHQTTEHIKGSYKIFLEDPNCAAVLFAGSSWVASRDRIDIIANGMRKRYKMDLDRQGIKRYMPYTGTIQNMDVPERRLWTFNQDGYRLFWDDIFTTEARTIKAEERRSEICPRRRGGMFCPNAHCTLNHGEALISV
ncbi:hypothetical protein BJ508DRAFT_79560 [Ascobolus immersus RN42]|uniref:Uncharacterized protein n=1 Tax=Ascobolus immersus RN42 TaxID=1160509 RepID=A0A3N4HCS6_ASCIM|nr:hypothetical protein BJ508DRAFT_79560 [Ascobolus immersus RN42]